jgi:dihydrofolate synthase / folylpolyglutamate synthase
MTYDDAIAWWYGLIDYERRAPQPDDLKLEQMRALLGLLGDPHRRLRIIHVAGSKGKGSTSAMLAQVLRSAGYSTGLFTSPHLIAVEERIQTNGQSISHAEITVLLNEVHDALTPNITPTFFEVCTAVGFLHFVRRRVELAVIEVGLGGRFDSTNVVNPLLAIITSISYDHTKILGDTLGQIAFEKAGILKPGRPAVSGVLAPEAMIVIEQIARERRCPFVQLGRDFHATYSHGHVQGGRSRVSIRTKTRQWPESELSLLGAHQAANAAVVVASVEELRRQGLNISDDSVVRGLASVNWPARVEVLHRKPIVILDCAHNGASIQALIDTVIESFPAARRLLIFAASSDKDVPGMLRLLAQRFDRILLTRYTHNQRAVPPERLAECLREIGSTPNEVHSSASAAWRSAWAQAKSDDLIVVTGSVFLAGELRLEIMETLRS